MRTVEMIYISFVLFLVAAIIIFGIVLIKYFSILEIRYKKEMEDIKLKDKKLEYDIAKANLELAKTYEALSKQNEEQPKDTNPNLSFGGAVLSVFEEIEGEENK